MALLKRLQTDNPADSLESPAKTSLASLATPASKSNNGGTTALAYFELKEQIHRRLIDKLDLTKIDSIPKSQLKTQVRDVVESLFDSETLHSDYNREQLTEEILNEVFGLGPLEPLLNDGSISDILVNSHKQVYVERNGKLELTNTVFKDEDHLMNIIDRIVSRVGRRVDESSPMVDARLMDGSRFNAIIPPLAIDGASASIRKFGTYKMVMDDLINFKSITLVIAKLLEGCVKGRLNVLVSGGTGSGKTTLLNILSGYIPTDERIITVEDAAELQLKQEHVVRLETRPPNLEGRGVVSIRDLVRNALRMRPDRIVVGECRGAEALDMLQAMNTGHDGSLTTLHANSPRDALRRLETMILMAGTSLPNRAMREQISSAIHVIIQAARLSDGSRKVICVSEITGMEGETITLQDLFVFEKMGLTASGKVRGGFRTTGIRPKFAEQLEAAGIDLPTDIFEQSFEPCWTEEDEK
ncbi:CpaF family protein [candidate division KSB1 bacterium]|nr:CpaF family protein [candidate division KSB1 bacterium]